MAEKFTIAVWDNSGLPKSGASVSLVGATTYAGTELGVSGKYFFNAINVGKYFLWVNGANTGESFAVGDGEVAGLGYSDGKYIKSGSSSLVLDEIGIEDVTGLGVALGDKVSKNGDTMTGELQINQPYANVKLSEDEISLIGDYGMCIFKVYRSNPLKVEMKNIDTGRTTIIEAGKSIIQSVGANSSEFSPTDLQFNGVSFKDFSIPRDTPALDYTGFLTPATVGMSYNPTTRKVTITANGNALYRNNAVTFADGWESPEHTNADGGYFLYYREGSIFFESSPWVFSDLMIAFVYRDGVNVCLRECHGLMPHTAHKEFHETIGTYLSSGLDMSSLVVNSTTADDRRPLVSSGVINDEDLPTTISAITVKTDYTKLSLVGTTNPATFTQSQTDIIDLSGNQPYWNSFSGGTWGQTLFTANQYGKIFLMAIPVTDDAECQKNRLIFVQPQVVSTNLATIQELSPSSLNLGQISGAVPEYCFVGEIIIRYTASNWVVTSFSKLTGTKISQGSAPVNLTDTQQAYNNSPDGKTTTDTTRGAVKYQRGTALDYDNVLEILNGAGSVEASIKGDGTAEFDRAIINRPRLVDKEDSLTLESNFPTLSFVESNGSADAKRWRFSANVDVFYLTLRNDLDTAGSEVFYVERSGITPTRLGVLPPLKTNAIQSVPLRINATTVLSGNRQNITFYGSTASQTITIPLATGSGNMLRVINASTVSVTLSFAGSTLYGASTFVLRPAESLDLLDDESTKWIV